MHTLHVQAPTAAPGTRLEPGPWSGGFGSEAYGPPSGHEDRCTTAGGGRPREVLSCLWEPGRHDCQAEDNSRCPGPPLLTATLCCRAAAIPPVTALRPPSWLPPSSSAPAPGDMGHSEAHRLCFLAASGESQGDQTRPLVEEWRRPSAKPGELASQGSLLSVCPFIC